MTLAMPGIERNKVLTISLSSGNAEINLNTRSNLANRAIIANWPVAGINESRMIEKSNIFQPFLKYLPTCGDTAVILNTASSINTPSTD